MATAYDETQKQRSALNESELAQMQHLTDVWTDIVVTLRDDINAVSREIGRRRTAGETLSVDLLRSLDRYQALLRQASGQALAYAGIVQDDVARSYVELANQGVQNAVDVLQMSGSRAALDLRFDQIDIAGITNLAGMLADGTPVREIIMARWPEVWQSVEQEMLRGAAKGMAPSSIAQAIQSRFGGVMHDVLRIVRTENLRAYRTATRETYVQSSVVKRYKRVATKDTRTCLACLALDGREYPVTDPLIDHPMGRCAMVPIVDGTQAPTWQLAPKWFEGLDESEQRDMLGEVKYEAWINGQFNFGDLAIQLPDAVWGGKLKVATLEDLGIEK